MKRIVKDQFVWIGIFLVATTVWFYFNPKITYMPTNPYIREVTKGKDFTLGDVNDLSYTQFEDQPVIKISTGKLTEYPEDIVFVWTQSWNWTMHLAIAFCGTVLILLVFRIGNLTSPSK